MSTGLYLEELKSLWQETFGDTREYIDDFFEAHYQPQNTLVHMEEGVPAAALYMIPYQRKTLTGTQNLYYLYALATKKTFRRQGIMGSLLQHAELTAKERGIDALFLIPANPELFDYYVKAGYREGGALTQLIIQRSDLLDFLKTMNIDQHQILLQPGTDGQIWDYYTKSPYYQETCVLLSRRQHSFYLEQLEKSGGKQMLFFTENGNGGYLLYQPQQHSGVLTIYESDVTLNLLPGLLTALMETENFENLIFYQPFSGIPEDGFLRDHLHTEPFIMVKNVSGVLNTEDKFFVNKVLK